ncbi:hypothetical protein JW949_00750 [Candidatus Woesearchaeota archaeon]|nr:hypothetical protein [Candidatus Woesearchaeota archaeon]
MVIKRGIWNKSIFLLVFSLVFLFLFSGLGSAIITNAPPLSQRTVTFEPGLEKEWDFLVGGAENIRVTVEGPLEEYITLTDPDPDGGPRAVNVKLELPYEELEPGMYKNRIRVAPAPTQGNNVGAVAAIGILIQVKCLYPGEYIEYEFRASDTNVGEDSEMVFRVKSWGKDNITVLYGEVDVFNPDEDKIKTLKTPITNLISDEDKTLNVNFSTDGLTPGIYTAKSTVIYDGKNKTGINDSFRIGSPNIFINNWTHELYTDAINKFDIKIESDWGNDIEDVYGIITLKTENGDIQSKTPNIDLDKFQKKTLEGYINTNGLELGEYDVNLNVFYLNTNTEKDVKVSVVKGEIPEGQKYKGVTITLSVTSLLLIILILIVIGNISYFAYKIMKARKKK